MKNLDLIEQLYTVFSKYNLAGMHYCDCGCIDENDVKKIARVPLRLFDEETLFPYHTSALYTWGDVKHYKYYLPRVLELCVKKEANLIDLSEVFQKLEVADWKTWGNSETQIVKYFLIDSWKGYINNPDNSSDFEAIWEYNLFFTLKELLEVWNIHTNDKNFEKFINYLSYVISDMDEEEKEVIFEVFDKAILIESLEGFFFKKEGTEIAIETSFILNIIENS